VFGKQTLRELSEATGKTKLGIKKSFKRITVPAKQHQPRTINLVVDVSFFGKKETGQWGVLVFRDPVKSEDLWWRFVDDEKLVHYLEGLVFLEQTGYEISSITCDGFRGLLKIFNDYPVQFCHFHQKQIIRRYVTQNPRSIAGADLKEVVEMLGEVSKIEFTQYLKAYLNRYQTFLNEKTINPLTGRSTFTHRRLRSAVRSLVTNLPHLFTYENYPHRKIPNTTNSLESHFSHIKDILRIHRGLTRSVKEKMIETILCNSSIVKPNKPESRDPKV